MDIIKIVELSPQLRDFQTEMLEYKVLNPFSVYIKETVKVRKITEVNRKIFSKRSHNHLIF